MGRIPLRSDQYDGRRWSCGGSGVWARQGSRGAGVSVASAADAASGGRRDGPECHPSMNRADEAGDRGRVGTVGSVVVKRRNEEAFVPSRRVVRTNHNALENMAPSSSFGLVMT